jgi:hypothetical protein
LVKKINQNKKKTKKKTKTFTLLASALHSQKRNASHLRSDKQKINSANACGALEIQMKQKKIKKKKKKTLLRIRTLTTGHRPLSH